MSLFWIAGCLNIILQLFVVSYSWSLQCLVWFVSIPIRDSVLSIKWLLYKAELFIKWAWVVSTYHCMMHSVLRFFPLSMSSFIESFCSACAFLSIWLHELFLYFLNFVVFLWALCFWFQWLGSKKKKRKTSGWWQAVH